MSSFHAAELQGRAFLRIAGADACSFLDRLVTADVEAIPSGGAGYGALLTPQGKILSDFLIVRLDADYLLDAPVEAAADLVKRLTLYKLRAAVTVADVTADLAVLALWGGDEPPAMPGHVVRDPRDPELGFRAYVSRAAAGAAQGFAGALIESAEAYRARRVALGVTEAVADYPLGDAFPHEAALDQIGAVAFDKGCYVGQEVVSRMQHRGTARRRPVIVRAETALPPPGTEIVAGGRPAGTLGTVAGNEGLAIVRLDRIRTAMDGGLTIAANDVTVSVSLPPSARYGWRATAGTTDLWPTAPVRRRAPGSACCRAAGSTFSTPPPSTSRSRTSPTASPESPAGTVRPSAIMRFRSPALAAGGGDRRPHAARPDPAERLTVLLHDAPEYVIGDMISPFKAVMGGDYKTIEHRLQCAVHMRCGLKPDTPAALKSLTKKADIAAHTSRRWNSRASNPRKPGSSSGSPRASDARPRTARGSAWSPGRPARRRPASSPASGRSTPNAPHTADGFGRERRYTRTQEDPPAMIHVCSLARLEETVAAVGAKRVVSLVNAGTPMRIPAHVTGESHLFLPMNDIVEARDGMTLPGESQIETLFSWLGTWDRADPIVVHCFAGVSRSTAAAYSAVLALDPTRDEEELAFDLRAKSPTATPNRRIIAIADALLGRGGRMIRAVEAIGRGEDCMEGVPFSLELRLFR